ncbi:MAG: hypothetical protein H6R13_2525 [Proteobacteria bacterium]|nr:hypothetical protein [Pseudomonadota bacterium]
MDIHVFVGLLFATPSLAFAVWRLKRAIKAQDEELFFWGGGLYFAVAPIFVDTLLLAAGEFAEINQAISSENASYWTGADSVVLMHAAIFVFMFNVTYWIFSDVAKSVIHIPAAKKDGRFSTVGVILLLLVAYSVLYVSLLEGVDFIQKQKDELQTTFISTLSQLLLPISAVGFFLHAKENKYLLAILFALPLVVVGVVGQARAMFFYIPAALVMLHVLKNNGRLKLLKLMVVAIALLCCSVLVKIAANEDHGFWYSENKILFFIANVLRDVSVGDLYYAVSVRNEAEYSTTQGSSSLALVLTGVVPPFLAKGLFDPVNTVIYKIYQMRFGEYSFGSVHPTIYGCAYFDLGYVGLLLAIFFPIVLRFFKKLFSVYFFSRAAILIITSGFWFVAMRGSPNVAYFRYFYSSVLIFAVLYVVYLIQCSYSRDRLFIPRR